MNFRKYKKQHQLTKQPFGINDSNDAAIPISWAKARNWFNKGWTVRFLDRRRK